MEITKKIREIEKHLDTLASNDEEKIAILSAAQSHAEDENDIAIFAIIKNRIIHS